EPVPFANLVRDRPRPLADALGIVHASTDFDGGYDPLRLIVAHNRLQGLSQAERTAALIEYDELAYQLLLAGDDHDTSRHKATLLLAVLHRDRPKEVRSLYDLAGEGYKPGIDYSPTDYPLLPIVFFDDVPYFLQTRVAWAGPLIWTAKPFTSSCVSVR